MSDKFEINESNETPSMDETKDFGIDVESTIEKLTEIADNASEGIELDKEALQERVDALVGEEPLEEAKLDIVLENSKLDNYEVILEKFTDILTMSENNLISNNVDKPRNIVNIAHELFTEGVKFCDSNSMDDLYKFMAKNFEYLGIYLFTFSAEESMVGILTKKIDNLLYDFIGNQEDLLNQFNVFQSNFRNERNNDLKSLVSPVIFNLSNIGTNIACIKCIIHYIKLNEETSTEKVLENILLQMDNKDNDALEEAIAEESTH